MTSISRADAMRPAAEAAIDRFFGGRISDLIGPLGSLYVLKRMQAEAGHGPLLDDDRDNILQRAREQDEQLAALDNARRTFKQRLRAATSASDIRAILNELEGS